MLVCSRCCVCTCRKQGSLLAQDGAACCLRRGLCMIFIVMALITRNIRIEAVDAVVRPSSCNGWHNTTAVHHTGAVQYQITKRKAQALSKIGEQVAVGSAKHAKLCESNCMMVGATLSNRLSPISSHDCQEHHKRTFNKSASCDYTSLTNTPCTCHA